MKHWPLRISPRRAAFGGTICLILGAVTTVGVAWGCVAAAHRIPQGATSFLTARAITMFPPGGIESLRSADRQWIQSMPFENSIKRQDWTDWWIEEQVRCGFRETLFHRVPAGMGHFEGLWIPDGERTQSGWPILAMRSERIRRSIDDRFEDCETFWALELKATSLIRPFGEFAPFDVPLRPIFPSFLINSLFYTAIWFGLFFAVGRTRRFIRTRRGRCPRCGYDLRGEFKDGCSECGWNRAASGSADALEQNAEGSMP